MKANTILITNDDGIAAPGLKALAEVMKELGEITIVAPDSPQSGMGHAITINNTLHVEHLTGFLNTPNAYTCSGTPVDCVKMAVHEIMKKKPSICVSGINHGSNSSINVIYSGTMSAAVEAGIEGIPSIGFSFCNYSWEANFEPLKKYVKKITSEVLKNGLPEGVVLNVNFPNTENIKGIKICRQAKAIWEEEFDKRTNPMGKEYYWLTGKFVNHDKGEDTDEWALANGYISIVPVHFDLTAYHAVQQLNSWDL